MGNVTGYLTSLFMKYSDFTISRSRAEHHNVGCIGCRVSPHTGILERTDIASAKSQGPIDQASLSCNACVSLIVYFGCRRVYVASHMRLFVLYLISLHFLTYSSSLFSITGLSQHVMTSRKYCIMENSLLSFSNLLMFSINSFDLSNTENI